MPILSVKVDSVGQTGVKPSIIYIYTDDTQAQVLVPGYLNKVSSLGFDLNELQMSLVSTKEDNASPFQTSFYNVLQGPDGFSLVLAQSGGEFQNIKVESIEIINPEGNFIVINPPETGLTDTTYTLPASLMPGVLTTDIDGVLSWESVGGVGTVTSISAGTGITCTPDPITSSGVVSLSSSPVTADSYTYGNGGFTVDAQGRLTAASSATNIVTEITAGTGLSGGIITGTGTIAIADTGVAAGFSTFETLEINAQGQIVSRSPNSVVVSITDSADITSSGGPSPSLYLTPSGVSPGFYNVPQITVDANGRVTNIYNGSGSSGIYSSGSSTVDDIAVWDNTSGSYLADTGYNLTRVNTSYYSMYFGLSSLPSGNAGSSGYYNIGFGPYSLQSNGSGSYNVAIGAYAMQTSGSPQNSTAVGYYSMYQNQGSDNTAYGFQAGYTCYYNSNCTFLGSYADTNDQYISNSTAVGAQAKVGYSNTMVLGTNQTVFVGNYGSNPTSISGRQSAIETTDSTDSSTYGAGVFYRDTGLWPTYYDSSFSGGSLMYSYSGLMRINAGDSYGKGTGAVVTAGTYGGQQTCGTASLSSGSVYVGTTAITSSSIVMLTYKYGGAVSNGGHLSWGSVSDNSYFYIYSDNGSDYNEVAYLIINP